MILDTSFVIDLIRGKPGAVSRLEDVRARNRPQKVSAVTVLDLYEGVGRTQRSDAERQAVLDVLDSKSVVPATHAIMRRAGEISGRLYDDGTPIDREECVVAATGLSEDEPVITRNRRHFDRIAGVDVVGY
jgi:predicted nucleic acid-binding protein